MDEIDVLIAGAGPVGLTAALQLTRWGVSVRVVDAADGPATTSRALGTHARSLEIYDQLGILGDLAPYGTRVNGFVRHQGRRTLRADYDFGELTTRFPYMFNLDQVITERVLRGHLAAAGTAIEWGTALTSFEAGDEGVTAALRTAAGVDETVRARYLWGCDGGHSTVRKELGLPLTGEAAHTWLIADAVVHTDLARDALHWLFPAGGALMMFPFPDPGLWRLLDTTGNGDAGDPDAIGAQFRAKLSEALGTDTPVDRPRWVSKFTIQQRAVPAMHRGRCFVSGDAAHVHSPASGQGLNTGIQDAYNLAWKLAMVVRGEADAALLDSYDAERVPIGQALLASTGEVMNTAMVDSGGTDPAEAQAADRAFMRQLIRSMSGLRIAYPDSPLTVAASRPHPGPQPGERLTQISAADAGSAGWTALRSRLRTPAWHLLMADQDHPGSDESSSARSADVDPAWLQRVIVSGSRPTGDDVAVWDPDRTVRRTLGLTDGDWVLARPDGYVSARGAGEADLRRAIDWLPGVGRP